MDFVDHSYDYRRNWTPLSPIAITDLKYRDQALFKIKLVTIRAEAALVISAIFFQVYCSFRPFDCFLFMYSFWLSFSGKQTQSGPS